MIIYDIENQIIIAMINIIIAKGAYIIDPDKIFPTTVAEVSWACACMVGATNIKMMAIKAKIFCCINLK